MKKSVIRRLEKMGINFVDAVLIYNELSNNGRQYVTKKSLLDYIK